MAKVEFRNVTKIFEGDDRAVDDLSLVVEDGEFLVLVGPSGCGKSTALRMVAGLESITDGEILADGEVLNDLTPQERDVAMVFQNYALYPHKTVRQNLDFPLRMMKVSKDQRAEKIDEVARLLGLRPFLDRKPRQLSGGQQQRVAMGRALVRDPKVFLLDEPLSNLDAKLRVEIRAEIADLQRRIGITTIYVTHDQVEAMTLGDRVAVLRDGRLQQVSPSQELYEHPANVFVARFIGSPSMNIIRAMLRRNDRGLAVEFGGGRFEVAIEKVGDVARLENHVDKAILAGLRPEAFAEQDGATSQTTFKARVRAIEALGHEQIAYCESPLELLTEAEVAAGNPGDSDKDSPSEGRNQDQSSGRGERPTLLVARLPVGRHAERDAELTLGVDASRMHLFDRAGHRL